MVQFSGLCRSTATPAAVDQCSYFMFWDTLTYTAACKCFFLTSQNSFNPCLGYVCLFFLHNISVSVGISDYLACSIFLEHKIKVCASWNTPCGFFMVFFFLLLDHHPLLETFLVSPYWNISDINGCSTFQMWSLHLIQNFFFFSNLHLQPWTSVVTSQMHKKSIFKMRQGLILKNIRFTHICHIFAVQNPKTFSGIFLSGVL